jgi:hypothetical protein
VNRQIPGMEYAGQPRQTYPRSQIYGSMRIVASSSPHPRKNYDTAFPPSRS